MTREEMIKIIIKMYNETVEALEYADKEYNNDKKNTKKRDVYRYIVAQEAVLNDLCYELEIDDLIDDGLDDEEADYMNSNKYTRGKARTRELAIQLQADLSESSISYAELAEIQDKLRKLGTQYGLIREFKENGLI